MCPTVHKVATCKARTTTKGSADQEHYRFTPKHRWEIKLHIMSGIALWPWIKFLVRHYQHIDWHIYWHRVLFLSVMSIINTFLAIPDWLLYSRVVAQQALHPEPVFILGHPRTGTTHLHNLLAMDPAFAFCTTFHAGFPSSFIGMARLRPLLSPLLAKRRPMDNMALHWDLPGEDEIAITTWTGGTSPYSAIVLPREEKMRFRRLYTFGYSDGQALSHSKAPKGAGASSDECPDDGALHDEAGGLNKTGQQATGGPSHQQGGDGGGTPGGPSPQRGGNGAGQGVYHSHDLQQGGEGGGTSGCPGGHHKHDLQQSGEEVGEGVGLRSRRRQTGAIARPFGGQQSQEDSEEEHGQAAGWLSPHTEFLDSFDEHSQQAADVRGKKQAAETRGLRTSLAEEVAEARRALDLLHSLDEWRSCFLTFMKKVTLWHSISSSQASTNSSSSSQASRGAGPAPKPLLIKSPVHMARIPLFLDMFPKARFIHIHRHPLQVFQSAAHMADTYYWYTYLQMPTNAHTTDFILDQYELLYKEYMAGRAQVPAGQLHELSFDELEADPIAALRQIYIQFGWTERFEALLPKFEQYCHTLADFKRNHFNSLSPGMAAVVKRRWAPFSRQFGYE